MSLFLTPRSTGCVAIAICPRCNKKMHADDMVRDPNTLQWVCKDDQDQLDPWRLPTRRPEDISLQHPRPDVALESGD